MTSAPKRHLTYADICPYYTPSSLDALHGPTSGKVRVPSNINTAPDPVYDLDNRLWAISMYEATLRDGTTADQEALLDRGLLFDYWPDMFLPPRCRHLWETKFPQLGELRPQAAA